MIKQKNELNSTRTREAAAPITLSCFNSGHGLQPAFPSSPDRPLLRRSYPRALTQSSEMRKHGHGVLVRRLL